MHLKEYLFSKRKSVVDFSKEIGYARSTISQIANDQWIPGKRLAKAIEEGTEGKVKFKSSKKEPKAKPKPKKKTKKA